MDSKVMFPPPQPANSSESNQATPSPKPRTPQQRPPISPYEAANGISPVVWEVLMRPV
ncbi:hypothetical protein [Pseudanabaena sp. FACHB-2040]|uniref:hypothetical protein n=1 Tax=Pseudanabaena sp. FACHB-2040 TaxID=2692859 RepID=UPI00168248F0|nr:hypothetical protein [Pseudanabaena sp. FACHB-2040]MBD2256767.1 hypothetical protein [Pseudanabaena sp. FACHB-2040]